jgi:hypothetical protein
MLQEDNAIDAKENLALSTSSNTSPGRSHDTTPTRPLSAASNNGPPLTKRQMDFLQRIEEIAGPDFDLEAFFIQNTDKLADMKLSQGAWEETPEQKSMLDKAENIEALLSGTEIERVPSPTDSQIETLIGLLKQLIGDVPDIAPEHAG